MFSSFRLINLQELLKAAEDLDVWLKNIEEKLKKQHGITTDQADLERLIQQLKAWQNEHGESIEKVQKLKSVADEFQLKELEDSTDELLERWRLVGDEIRTRQETLTGTVPMSVTLKERLFSESQWLNDTYDLLQKQTRVPDSETEQVEMLNAYKVCMNFD